MFKMYFILFFLQTQDSEESVAPTSVTAAAVTSATPEPAAPTALDKEDEDEVEEEDPEISEKDKVGLVLSLSFDHSVSSQNALLIIFIYNLLYLIILV